MIGGDFSSEIGTVLVSVVTTRFFWQSNMSVKHRRNCRFLVAKLNIQNVTARFALSTLVIVFIILFGHSIWTKKHLCLEKNYQDESDLK